MHMGAKLTRGRLVMVNFMCQLRDVQMSDKNSISGCVCVSWEDISIWIIRLSEGDYPYQFEWASFNLLRTRAEQKCRGRSICFLLELRHPPSPNLGHPLALLVLRFLDSDWDLHHWPPISQAFRLTLNYTTSAFLALQLADGRSWDFFASRTMWANSFNKCPHPSHPPSIYITPIASVSLENPNSHNYIIVASS